MFYYLLNIFCHCILLVNIGIILLLLEVFLNKILYFNIFIHICVFKMYLIHIIILTISIRDTYGLHECFSNSTLLPRITFGFDNYPFGVVRFLPLTKLWPRYNALATDLKPKPWL